MKVGDTVTVKEPHGSYLGKDWQGEITKIDNKPVFPPSVVLVKVLTKKSPFHGREYYRLVKNLEVNPCEHKNVYPCGKQEKGDGTYIQLYTCIACKSTITLNENYLSKTSVKERALYE